MEELKFIHRETMSVSQYADEAQKRKALFQFRANRDAVAEELLDRGFSEVAKSHRRKAKVKVKDVLDYTGEFLEDDEETWKLLYTVEVLK